VDVPVFVGSRQEQTPDDFTDENSIATRGLDNVKLKEISIGGVSGKIEEKRSRPTPREHGPSRC